jgi:hypothetical protein
VAPIAVIAADLAALRPYFPLQISIFWTSYPWSVLRDDREFLPPNSRRLGFAMIPPNFPNLGLAMMVLVLEIGLFRLASRQGRERTFWLGFEIAGWLCVIMCSVFAQTIWWRARSVFEGYVLGRQIGRPLDMGRFVLFTGGLHFAVSLAIAVFTGILACSAWRRWAQE